MAQRRQKVFQQAPSESVRALWMEALTDFGILHRFEEDTRKPTASYGPDQIIRDPTELTVRRQERYRSFMSWEG